MHRVVPLRCEEPLELPRASQPGIDERIGVARRLRLPAGRCGVFRDRRGLLSPGFAARRRWMDEQHIDLARRSRSSLRGHRCQPLKQGDLMERQPLETRDEHGLGSRAFGRPLTGRGAWLTDRGSHLPPEVKLPVVARS